MFVTELLSDVFATGYDDLRSIAANKFSKLRAVHQASGDSVYHTDDGGHEWLVTDNRDCQLLSVDDVDQLIDELCCRVWCDFEEFLRSACHKFQVSAEQFSRQFRRYQRIGDCLDENDDTFDEIRHVIHYAVSIGCRRHYQRLTATDRRSFSAQTEAEKESRIDGQQWQRMLACAHENTSYARHIVDLLDDWLERDTSSATSQQRKRFVQLLAVGLSVPKAAKRTGIARATAFRFQSQLEDYLVNESLKWDLDEITWSDSTLVAKAVHKLRECSRVTGGYRARRCEDHSYDYHAHNTPRPTAVDSPHYDDMSADCDDDKFDITIGDQLPVKREIETIYVT